MAEPLPSPQPCAYPYMHLARISVNQLVYPYLSTAWNEWLASNTNDAATHLAIIDILTTLKYKGDTPIKEMKAAYKEITFEDWEMRSDVDIQEIIWAHPQHFDVTPDANDCFIVSQHAAAVAAAMAAAAAPAH
jgi:hypothetical protein